MKKQESKKSTKWILLAACLVVLLVVVGLVMYLRGDSHAAPPDNETTADPTGENTEATSTGPDGSGEWADLYWNVDREKYAGQSEAGFSSRPKEDDGYYHVVFAFESEHIELKVSEVQMLNRIDGLDLMGLEVDDNGVITAVHKVEDVTGGYVAEQLYVQEFRGNRCTLNSSADFKGMTTELVVEDFTQMYDVSITADKVGKVCEPVRTDRVMAIQNYAGEVTHIYIVSHAVTGSVYWNVTRMWDATKGESTRIPDANGDYSFLLAVDGAQVTLKSNQKAVADYIDSQAAKCVGLVVGDDGYIISTMAASKATGGTYFGSWHDVTAIEDGFVYIEKKIQATDTGSTGVCKMAANCRVFDVSGIGDFIGVETELRVGDRIQGWTNVQNELCTVFVVTRPADSVMYWNIEPKYNSKTRSTTRVPNAQGYYEIKLAHDGGNSVFRTADKELITSIDAVAARVCGLKVDGDIILRVYGAGTIYMGSNFGDWHDVIGVVNDRVEILKDPKSTASNAGDHRTGFMAADCKVYDVSIGANVIGEETTLRVGDRILGYMNIDQEIKIIWVISGRTVPGEVYWNLSRKYDDATASTTRTPVDGWYLIDMAVNGKQVTLRTQDKAIATQVDKYAARCMGLKVNGTVIQKVYGTGSMTGGKEVASWYDVMWINGNTFFTERTMNPYLGQTVQLTMASNCQVFNVSSNYINFAGEKTTLKVGDRVHVLTNKKGEAYIVYVVNRALEADVIYNISRQYDSATGETTRTPDSDGWYNILIARNGEQVTVRTRDKAMASKVDSYAGAIMGMLTSDDNEILRVVAGNAVIGCEGGYVGDWGDVMDITPDGKLHMVKNSIAANTGAEWYNPLAEGCKIYDISSTAGFVGEKSTLRVGDRVVGLVNKKGEITVLFITTKNTHECLDCTANANYHYCEHCGKEVLWTHWAGTGAPNAPGDHYYLTKDVYNTTQKDFNLEGRDVVICLNGHTLHSNQRAFLVRNGATLTIVDHTSEKVEEQGTVTATGLSQANHTGVILLTNGTLNVYGGNIRLAEEHNTLTNAGVISIDAKSTANLYGGAVIGGDIAGESGTPGGGAIHVSGGTLNIYDGVTICGGRAYNGGNLFVTAGATVNMYGGVITGGQAVGKYNSSTNGNGETVWTGAAGVGGNVRIDSGSTFNFFGGIIEDGSTVRVDHPTDEDASFGGNGGNVALYGTMNMSGNALITGGYSGNCGGNMALYGTLNMNGGTIENSDALKSGKGIFVVDTVTINVNGGTIDGQIEQTRTDAANAFPTIKLSGPAVLTELIIPVGERLTVDGLTDGARIRVKISDVFTDGTPDDPDDAYAKYFEVIDPVDGLEIVANEGALVYGKSQCECGGLLKDDPNHTCEDEFWTAWSDGSCLPTKTGNYILVTDVTCDQNEIEADAKVKLDLNGKTVTANSGQRVYSAHNESKEGFIGLVITDSSANRDGKLIARGSVGQGGVLWARYKAEIRIYAGILDASQVVSTNAEGGAAINLAANGTVDMYGGEIIGGEVKMNAITRRGGNGAAVSITSGTFTMHGGKITGGKAANQGGAVHITAAGTLTMKGGEIVGGAAKSGGNVSVLGTLNLEGGTVENGEAQNGGNIWLSDSAALTIDGASEENHATVTGGKAELLGGNIYAEKNATITVEGYGEVSNGVLSGEDNAKTEGSNIYLVSSGKDIKNDDESVTHVAALTIRDHAQIVGSADANDSSIYAKGSSADAMTDINIEGGTIVGGHFDVYDAVSLKLSGAPVVCDEEAPYDLRLSSDFTGLIDATELTQDAKIGITVQGEDRAFATVSGEDVKDCFVYKDLDDEKHVVAYEDGKLYKRVAE